MKTRRRPAPRLLLGRRLTLVAAGIASFLALGYMLAGVWFAKIQLEREFRQNSELAAASLASSLIEVMLTYNIHEIPDLLDNAHLANPDIRYGFVTDARGNPVAHSRTLPAGVPGDLQRLARQHVQTGGGEREYFLRTQEGDVFHLVFPLEGRPGGYLHLGFSLEPITSKLRITARHLISSMSVGLLLSALAGGLVYRRMAQPISELTSAAAEFGAGNLTRRVAHDASTEDEVGLLAQAFNRMADQLQEKVTELTRSQRDLADEKARVQAILDGMMHGVVFYEPDGSVGYWNQTARKNWGIKEDGPTTMETLHAGQTEVMNALESAARDQEFSRRLQVKRGDRTLDLFISPLVREGRGFLGTIEISADITEQVASTRALAHAEKLNVVGQLAAGMAHEINSPLDGAIEAARIIERGDMDPEEVREFARAQRTALERIAAIIYRLLTFSRMEQARQGSTRLETSITEAVELVRYRLKNSGLSIEVPDAKAMLQVIGGAALELSQIFVNLLGNAIDASPAGGVIRIEVEEHDGRVDIAVIDQGPGIPEEAERRLFTPFFTTKEVGKGTGLGLAISKNIVEQFGGAIEFMNQAPPWGARFTVHLPWDGTRANV
ncbi:MAG TPA: ATP-binding protein [bacterium]|nr:ATP-binding protein [bacterium]